MSEQGGGGGVDSGFLPGHTRTKSGKDAGPAEADVETQRAPAEEETDRDFAQRAPEDMRAIHRLERHAMAQDTQAGAFGAETAKLPASPPSSPAATLAGGPRRYISPQCHISVGSADDDGNNNNINNRRPEPPVTKTTLSELDVSKIIHNPKLRHDINFDPELHFRPNLDGEKGRRKTERANQFWSRLEEQLVQFVLDRDGFNRQLEEDGDWCLPMLLRAAKEIIETLVPARDKQLLDEGLNVDLLMQQFNRGIADLEKLAAWLSSVLKLHCAPMRDEWVDEMYHELSAGNRTNDMALLVKGMRSLLSVLEAMKLDVANHQIRCLRPALIEDTVHFEKRFFCKKMESQKMEVGLARRWYRASTAGLSRARPRQALDFGDMTAFFQGLARLLLPSVDTQRIPNTFLFDEERLMKLRSDMLDAVNLEVCMRVYEQSGDACAALLLPAYVRQAADDGASLRSVPSSEFDFNAPPSSSSSASPSRPSSLVFGVGGSSSSSSSGGGGGGGSCHSPDSSPRNSGLLFAGTPQPVDLFEAKAKSRSLYGSLLALLHTAPPAPPASRVAQRWQALTPAVAVQVFRFLNPLQRASSPSLLDMERRLQACLDPRSALYREVEECFYERLLAELARRVRGFRTLSGVGLFSVATGGRIHGPAVPGGHQSQQPQQPQQQQQQQQQQRPWEAAGRGERDSLDGRAKDAREDGGIEDMATRLAHLGILHWRVWAPIAYAEEVEVAAADDDVCN